MVNLTKGIFGNMFNLNIFDEDDKSSQKKKKKEVSIEVAQDDLAISESFLK